MTAQHDGVRVLSRIRADVSAIASAINVQTKMQARSTTSGPGGQRAPCGFRHGRAIVEWLAHRIRQPGDPGPASRAASSGSRRASPTVAATSSRDSSGRFVAGQSGASAGGGSLAAIGGGLSRLTDGMGPLSASLSSADNLDPTGNAMKGVADAVTPLGRGQFSMFGRSAERKKERWYQRIYRALTSPVAWDLSATACGGSSGIVEGDGSATGGVLAGRVEGLIVGCAGLVPGLSRLTGNGEAVFLQSAHNAYKCYGNA